MASIDWKNHFIELLIVIIGISVAFWLNNLASVQNEKKLESKYIQDLRSDLKKDSASLALSIRFNEKKVSVLKSGIELMVSDTDHSEIDSLMYCLSYIGNYDFFDPENFTLVSLLQSGDIKTISSDELKKELLRLLKIYEVLERNQNNLLEALDDNYFPMILGEVDMLTYKPQNPAFFYTLKVKNYCAYTMSDTNNLNYEFNKALNQINKILKLMEAI